MAEYYSIFARMLFDIRFDIRFEMEYFDLESSFLRHLLFNLGYRGLLFASMTNLEAGPRFARI